MGQNAHCEMRQNAHYEDGAKTPTVRWGKNAHYEMGQHAHYEMEQKRPL